MRNDLVVIPAIKDDPEVRQLIIKCDLKLMATVGNKLYERFIKDRNFSLSLANFINVCYSLDFAKQELLGFHTPPVNSNLLMQFAAAAWVRREMFVRDEISHLNRIVDKLSRAREGSQTFAPKLEGLLSMACDRRETMRFATGLRSLLAEPAGVDRLQKKLGDLTQATTNIMDFLRQHRKYGLKSAYFQDGILHRPDQAWVLTDLPDQWHEADSVGLYDSILGNVLLADKRSIKTLQPTFFKQNQKSARLGGVSYQIKGEFTWFLNQEGDLDILPGGLSVRDLMKENGYEIEYALLRLSMVVRLFDLMVPLEVVQQMPELPDQDDSANRTPKSAAERADSLSDPILVIPRLRRILDDSTLPDKFEAEYQEDEERTKRRMAKHEVVYHTRRLPRGHHASPEARARAEEAKIVLEEGETFVRKHARGSGDLSTRPHRAVTR